MTANQIKQFIILQVIIVIISGCSDSTLPSLATHTAPPITVSTNETASYWPTEGWRESTPEQQGIDSDILADMIESIQENGYNIHSTTIIRNGYLVTDAYFYPFSQGRKHIIHSCTKSITSALIGIAIAKGFIESVDQPMLDFFPEKTMANLNPAKESITLKDLLTMSSGLNCRDSYLYDWQGLNEMRASQDWVQHMLDLPMADQPGTRFEYCNGGSYLLSAIVQQVTGMTSLEFARQNLFDPLGITEVDWPASPQGINIGWGDMNLTPHDMAKFGYLYLNQGNWDGQQILTADFIEESTSAQISADTLSDSYGYQWWFDDNGYYMALGYAGQFIFVVPEHNMVVVFTSGLAPEDFFIPEILLNEFILPAADSSNSLPENSPATTQLAEITQAGANPPEPQPIPTHPEIASDVSGHTYIFEPGTMFKDFNLTFSEEIARFRLTWSKTIEVDIGLDEIYRLTDSAGYLRAYKGNWVDDKTFHIYYNIIGFSENGTWDITFENDQAIAKYHELTTGKHETSTAHLQR